MYVLALVVAGVLLITRTCTYDVCVCRYVSSRLGPRWAVDGRIYEPTAAVAAVAAAAAYNVVHVPARSEGGEEEPQHNLVCMYTQCVSFGFRQFCYVL